MRAWTDAIEDGSVQVSGDPALVSALPMWFVAGGARQPGKALGVERRARRAIARPAHAGVAARA